MIDDYELLYLINENSEEALTELYNKYCNLIYYKIGKYSKNSNNFDDFFNEAIVAFFEAIREYKDDRKFTTFLNLCIDRRLNNYKKTITRKKNIPLNIAISLDEENIEYSSVIDNNPEKILMEEESYNLLRNTILKKLNYQEELVFKLREHNFSCREIANIIDMKLPSIYKIINKIRKKINTNS